MSENDRIVLKAVLAGNKAEKAPELSDSAYFEIFTAEQILKDYDLSYEEIESGQIGGGGDGGIDSLYFFVNGNLIEDDTDISNLGRELNIELFFIQSKTESGFSEDPIRKYDITIKDLFDLSHDLTNFIAVYNENLRNSASRFRNMYSRYAARLPKLVINFQYVTFGDEVHPNVRRLVAELKSTVSRLFSSATFSFEFVGAAVLLTLIQDNFR